MSSEKAQVKPNFEMREREDRHFPYFTKHWLHHTLPHTYPPITPKSLSCISLFTPAVQCIAMHFRAPGPLL